MAEGRVKIDVDLNGEKAKSGIRGVRSSLERLSATGTRVGSIFKSVLGANLVSNAIVGSIRGISSGVKGLISELNSSSKAWQTFEGNMQMLGKSPEEIAKAKSAMQDFATKTIYSASDMAQTYSQLAAVGISETDKLVTGFGGLAAAAENPQQAMKTLSTQAVQMAAKPKVAWQDFKLMLEQTPAGISAIAKEMGMNTSEMVKAVQDGVLKTEDFFNAIKKVGNNANFSKMATEFKTIDQAIDGAKESLANKLEPAFKRFNSFGIKAVVAVTEALEKMDFNGIAEKLGSFLDSIDIESVISSVSNAIGTAIGIFQNFWPVIKTVGSVLFELGSIAIIVIGHIGKFLGSLSPGTVTALTYAVLGAVGAFKAFNFLKGFNPFGIFKRNAVGSMGSVIGKVKESSSVISKVFSGISNTISSVSNGISKIIKSIGTSISSIAKGIGAGISTIAQGIGTGLATAFRGLGMAIAMVPPVTWLALGAGIAIVCAGLALLATQSEGVSQILEALGTVVTKIINVAVEGMVKLIPIIVDGITTIMGAISNFISSVVPVISTAITNIVTSITQGIATIIGAISGLLDSVSNVFDSIANIISSVGQAIKDVLDGLGNTFNGLGNVIRVALEGVASVVGSVGSSIKSILEGLGSAFENFGKAVNNVCDGISKVIESVGSAIRNVLDGVAGIFDSIGEAALKAGEGFKLFAEGVKTLVDLSLTDIVSTITGLGLSLGTITGKSDELATLGGTMTSFGQGLLSVSQYATGLSGVLGGVANSINSFKSALESVPSILSSVVNSMSGFANGVISSLTTLGQAGTIILAFNGQAMSVSSTLSSVGSAVSSFATTISSMSGVISSVSGVVSNLGNSISSLGGVLGTVSSSVNSLIGVLNSLISSSTSVSNAFNIMASGVSSAGNSISNSMRIVQANISSACNAIVNIVKTCSNQMQNEGQKAGQNCVKAMSDRINAGRGAITSAMQSIKSSIEQVGNATVSSVTNIGARISQGVAQGMYSALGSVTAAANAIIYQVQRAMEAKAQIHSPARLFINKIGKYIPMGVAKGITKFSGVVNDSMGFIDDMVQGYKFNPESILSFGKGYAPIGTSTSNYNSVSNNTSNYSALLHIENFENKGEQDIRKLFEQIKFLTREERNRL